MNRGWIRLNRKIMDNFLWQDKEPFDRRSAWIDLLLMANHNDHDVIINGKIYHVKRGQVNRSILYLANRWNWSRGKVLRFLKALSDTSMITTDSTTDGTTITIENYDKYQGERTTVGTTDSTTDGTTDSTTHGQPTVQRTDTYKNNKELKRMINHYEECLYPADRQRLNDMRERIKRVNEERRLNNESM